MKKNINYIVLVICFFLIFNCIRMDIKREVKDNVFSSNSPNIRIQVAPELKYTGKNEGQNTKEFSDEYSISFREQSEIYRFAGTNSVVIINYKRMIGHGYYNLNLRNVKNRIDFGTFKINDEPYQYCVYCTYNEQKNRYYMIKEEATRINESTIFGILYAEYAPTHLFKNFTDSTVLTSDQRQFFNEFMNRNKKSVKILE